MGVFTLFGFGGAEGIVFGSVLYALVYGVNTTLWLGWGWVARAMTPRAKPASSLTTHEAAPISQPANITISGVRVDALTVPSLMAWLTNALDRNQQHVVMYANAHAINLAAQDPGLKTALNAADWVICDGWGLQWGARFLGMHLPARLTPPDWIHHLTLACAQRDAGMFLLGGQPGVAEAAARNFQHDCAPHALNIDAHHGYFEMHGPENAAIIDKINASGAAVLLVGMGMPRQETWIHANRQNLSHVKVIISVGALFDFVSGHMPRGPKWMTDNGLEWLFRLICEPGRLWRRYLLGNPAFMLHVIAQKFGISKTQTSSNDNLQ
ncbi:MAG: WecB/TagA/CpsF family glycosyltransferase [Anaerolineae bacterium]|nr:WecB/TagA/CpsF family glycosyltransferase [Anaerolineae bacterium]